MKVVEYLAIAIVFITKGHGAPLFYSPNSEEYKREIPNRDSTSYWGINFGPNYVLYSSNINKLIPDHFGANMELEFGGISNRLILHFSPATVKPEKSMLIWHDTVQTNQKINPVEWGILFGQRYVLSRRLETGYFFGFDWGIISETAGYPKFYSPVTPGIALGLDSYYTLLEVMGMEIGIKTVYRYSTPDYRIYNQSLDYGTHTFSLEVGLRSLYKK